MRVSIPLCFLIPGMVMLTGCGGGSDRSDSIAPILPSSPLSGVISIEANSRIDQDTMDQLGLAGASPAAVPQTLPASFVLAGYASASGGVYPEGSNACQPFEYRADPVDEFLVPMAPGETIVLQSFGTCASEAVLELSVEDEAPLLTGSDGPESATFTLNSGAAEGNYRVSVRNASPIPARYVLLKTAGTQQDTSAFHWPDHRFVDGEAIVTLAETDAGQMAPMAAGTGMVRRKLGERTWLATMDETAQATRAGQPRATTLEWIQALRHAPGVESAVPNYQMTSHSPVSEPLYSRQWHYGLINGPIAWQLESTGGAGVKVAVLDSGLFRATPSSWHPDLQANIISGYDFVDRDSNPEDPGNSVGGNVFHGTHVAGTIASVIDTKGSGGVAFGSSLLPVRVLGEGGTGSSADLIDAIAWLVNGPAGAAPLADVVNMSLGGLPEITQLESVIAAGVAKGMVFVAAAGNAATSAKSYPAASPNVLAVSAVDGAGNLASYSNYGSWIDLAAPGGDAGRDANSDGAADLVWSTSATQTSDGYEPDYRGLQGTSMAAPHVAGVVALMKSQNQQLDSGGVRALLQQGEMTDYGGSPTIQLGYGVLDAAKAVSAAASGFTGAVLSASPSVVSLSNEGAETQTIELNAYGSEPISAVSLGSFPDWLSVTEDFAQLPYSLEVTLIRDKLEPDVPARGTIVVSYNGAQELRVPVIGQLITDEQARNAGTHFVLLVNTEPDAEGFYWAEAQVAASVQNGQYAFRFEADDGEEPRQLNEVVPGDYFLVAGTDIDGDGFICQPGESCAEYPVSGLREVITIEAGQSISDVRMTTGFSRPTISAATPDILPRPGFKGYGLKNERRTPASDHPGLKGLQ